jgi:hypothetical protein
MTVLLADDSNPLALPRVEIRVPIIGYALCIYCLAGEATMLTARLKAPPDKKDRFFESKFFTFSDGALWNDIGREAAKHAKGLWRCAHEAFISVDFESPVLLQFSNPELSIREPLGPFPLRIIGASMCQMGDSPAVVAEFDEQERAWFITRRPELPMPRFVITKSWA